MAFVKEQGNVVAFAEFTDVENADQLVLKLNEGLNDSSIIDPLLVRATERILSKLQSSSWWRSYFMNRSSSGISKVSDIPPLNANYIISRQNDFTDLCVATAMSEYILPLVADFGSEDNAERQKMGYYSTRAEGLLKELVEAGDWYDFDGSGVITSDEKQATVTNLRRIR